MRWREKREVREGVRVERSSCFVLTCPAVSNMSRPTTSPSISASIRYASSVCVYVCVCVCVCVHVCVCVRAHVCVKIVLTTFLKFIPKSSLIANSLVPRPSSSCSVEGGHGEATTLHTACKSKEKIWEG